MGISLDMGGVDLAVNSLAIGASTPGAAGTNISSSELSVLDSVTAGTAAASKAVVLDSGTKISGIKNVTLAAGTATVAPLNLTSGTNLTSATAGAVEFDGDVFYATSQASSRQVVDAEQFIVQLTEPAADNNTGLDSASAATFFTAGSGTITLVAGKTYFFEGQYMLTNTGTTSHTWGHQLGGTATFTALGTGYGGWGLSSTANGTGTTGGGGGMVTGFTATGATTKITALTQASTSATENAVINVAGTLVVANAGTLIPQLIASARPGASGTPGVTHKAGSFFRVWEVPSVGSVGNWS